MPLADSNTSLARPFISNWIRSCFRSNPYLYGYGKELYLRFNRGNPTGLSGVGEKIQRQFANAKTVYFLQIGSNDGLQGDPLHQLVSNDRRYRGCFVEPISYLFDRLVQNYGYRPRFTFEEVAIDDRPGARYFHYVSKNYRHATNMTTASYLEQLGSFDRELLISNIEQKYIDDGILDFIVTEEVERVTFSQLIERNNLRTLDLLHIDTEGFDFQILRQIDFEQCRPKLILYEHIHLSGEDRSGAEKLLVSAGYLLEEVGRDTLATRE